jgi:hypothetical protein
MSVESQNQNQSAFKLRNASVVGGVATLSARDIICEQNVEGQIRHLRVDNELRRSAFYDFPARCTSAPLRKHKQILLFNHTEPV